MLLGFLFVVLILMMIFSVPISFCMGGAGVFTILIEGKVPVLGAIQKMFVGMDSLPLLAIPFFMLAGSLMQSGGISKRLVRFANSLVGHFKGGLAKVAVLASMLFAGVSGSSSADTAAIGSLMMPAMAKQGYTKGFTATLQACAGTIGPIIPPSILMIIYGSITGLSIGAMFLAGIIPGIMIGISLMIVAHIYAVKEKIPSNASLSLEEIKESFIDAKWALVMPFLIIGGILSGVFTATEAGMIAVVFGLFVGLFIYKELRFRDLPKIFLGSGKLSCSILLIIGFANIFGWVLARLQFPKASVEFLTSLSTNPNVIMLVIIIFFLILGCFIETVAAVIIFVPILFPIVNQFGYDPIHFALVVIVTLLIGQITPPVGVLLFLTTSMLKIPLKETFKYVSAFVGVMILTLIIIAYFPDLTMYIPRLFYK